MNKLITLVACLTLTVLLNAQTTIFVKPDGTGDGTSWTTACNLGNAVVSASLNDRMQIWVQKGTYYPSKMLVIPASVKIYGGFVGVETALSQRNFAANPTIVDGQQKIGSIFRLEDSAEINGFTIQNGNANGNPQKNGGGVWADENSVIENCKIINNAAMLNGGGVYSIGKVKITNSTIENNTANGSGSNTFGNCLIIKTNENNVSPNAIAGCNPHLPDFGEVSFKTQTIWTIPTTDGTQIWSDVVMASGCDKASYYGGILGSFYSDCRTNSDRSLYGDLFSWCAVTRFAHILCPAPWRVPTQKDFFDLDKAMGGYGDGSGPGTIGTDISGSYYTNGNYGQNWVSAYGGTCYGDASLRMQGAGSYIWAQSEYDAERGFAMYNHNTLALNRPLGRDEKSFGHTLRCVR